MQRPERVMVWLTENIQACLRDFQTGTASMARKRHLASTARGFLCFCLMTLVTTGLIRSIRLIRGRYKPILWRTALQAEVCGRLSIPRALPPVTQSSALQAPECMWGTCDVIALQAPECMWRLIRGKEETSRGWGAFCFYSAQIGFPWRTKKRGEQLANRKNSENLCSI